MAEDLARRSGLSLNEWVARLMAEGPEDATSQDYFSQSSANYYEAPRANAQPRFEAAGHPADEVGRVTQAMERLSDRIESAENRQAMAISGIERSVREVIGRLESAEREQMQVAARLEGELQAVKSETAGFSLKLREKDEDPAGPRAAEALRGLESAFDRIDATEREQTQVAARFEGELEEVKSEAFALTQRLAKVEEEAVGPRSAEALRALEAAIGTVAGHVYDGERRARENIELLRERMDRIAAEQSVDSVRELKDNIGDLNRRVEQLAADTTTVDAVGELKDNLGALSERIEQLGAAEPSVPGAVQDLADNYNELRARLERLDTGDSAAADAIRDLKDTCGRLDQRLSLAERGAAESVSRAAEEMSARVQEARFEMGRQLAAATDARFDRVELALHEMSEHVRVAEQRSAGAMERMGREVLDVAQTLHRRVQAAEAHSTDTAERVNAEVSRVATAVEDRLARADSLQAQALEKLGGEIARITERLADRIASAERRSAKAIDDVGEQVSRVTERINQRSERSASELAERIRQSEERTAKLLEEAREKLEERLAETHRRISESGARAASPIYDAPDDLEDGPFSAAPFPGYETPPAEQPFPTAAVAAPAPTPTPIPHVETSPFDDADFEAASPFSQAADPFETSGALRPPQSAPAAPMAAPSFELDDVELEPNVGFDVDDEWLGPSTSASGGRPAAPANMPFPPRAAEPAAADAPPTARAEPAPGGAPLTTREVIERARAAARASSDLPASRLRAPSKPGEDSILQGLSSFGRTRKRPTGPSGALMVASVLAAVGLSAGGYVFFEGKPGGKMPKRVADALSVVTGDTPDTSSTATPMAAVAFAPKPDAAGPDLSQAYSAAVAKITSNQAGGLSDIRKLADGGYAPAEFYLGELYQDGKAGLKKDAGESRRWLERGAEGGDRTAMHNLALDEHEGVGGPRNASGAADWFRRAAELGLVDSQFNLAAIYEHGDGVSTNPAEAYKWYLIASRTGDAEAKAGALRVRGGLSADARAVAERAAAEFQPTPPNPAAAVAAPAGPPPVSSPDLVTAQRALNQLGYYQGPTDGVASEALTGAIRAYQSAQGLPVTGAPDAATIGKLSVYTQ